MFVRNKNFASQLWCRSAAVADDDHLGIQLIVWFIATGNFLLSSRDHTAYEITAPRRAMSNTQRDQLAVVLFALGLNASGFGFGFGLGFGFCVFVYWTAGYDDVFVVH